MSTNVRRYVGIYPSAERAEYTVDALIQAGFTSNDVSVLFPDSGSSKDFAHEKHTKAREGTAAGVTAGGALGGTLGLLGIGALAIPGWGRSSRPVPSWPPWRDSVLAAPPVA